MKTKIIPFDLETAKKIQAGEIDGRIVTSENLLVRIVDFNLKDKTDSIVYIGTYANGEQEFIQTCDNEGKSFGVDVLVIELPEETPKHEFKTFDRVLVRDEDSANWKPVFYGYYDKENDPFSHICSDGFGWKQCIPYEGNEHLVGTTDKPKEE